MSTVLLIVAFIQQHPVLWYPVGSAIIDAVAGLVKQRWPKFEGVTRYLSCNLDGFIAAMARARGVSLPADQTGSQSIQDDGTAE